MATQTEKAVVEAYLNNTKVLSSVKEMEGAMKSLKTVIRSTEDPALRAQAIEQYKKIRDQVSEITSELKTQKDAWDRIKETAGALGLAGGIYAAVSALKQFATDSFKAYIDNEKHETRLLNALKGREDVQRRLLGQANRLRDTLGISDSVIVEQQTFLANQGRTETQIRKTIDAAVQLSAVTGDDLEASIKKLDVTFEGTVGKLGKLDDGFNKLTKEQLANGAAIDMVIEKYGTFAQDSSGTTANALSVLSQNFGELQEAIGKAIAKGGGFIGFLNEFISKSRQLIDPSAHDADFNMAATLKYQEKYLASFQKFRDDMRATGSTKQDSDLELEYNKQNNDQIVKLYKAMTNAKSAAAKSQLLFVVTLLDQEKNAVANFLKDEKEGKLKAERIVSDEKKALAAEQQKIAEASAKQRLQSINTLQSELVALQLESLKDEVEKAVAAEEQKYQAKKSGLEKEITLHSRDKELVALAHAALEQLEQNHIDSLAAIVQAGNEKLRKDGLKQDLDNLKDWHQIEIAEITNQRVQNLTSEKEYQQQLFDHQKLYLIGKIKNLQDYGQSTAEVEKEMSDLVLKNQAETLRAQGELWKEATKSLSKEKQEELALEYEALAIMTTTGISITGETAEEMLSHIEEVLSGTTERMTELFDMIGQRVGELGSVVSGMWGSILDIAENKNAKFLQKNKKALDSEVKGYKSMLTRKLLTQEQYDAKVAAAQEEFDKKQRKMARENAARNKKLAIFNAVISTAQAVVGQLSMSPVGPWNYVLAALMAVAGGLQIAAIASEPLPELRRGKRFTGGGKHPVSQQKVTDEAGNSFLVEDDETLLSADTRAKNPDLVDALLDASLNNNGELKGDALDRELPQINTSRASETSRLLRQGAFQVAAPGSDGGPLAGEISADRAGRNDPDTSVLHKLNDTLSRILDEGVEAKLTHRQFRRDLKRLDTITGTKG
jgi:hypothetical protein